MSNDALYSEAHYHATVSGYGYSPIYFESFTFAIGSQSFGELNLRYLCHQRVQDFLNTAPDNRLITTGFGMSGPPHLGSISQILRMIAFQKDGERCQIVLGDLDSYNGRNIDLPYARELAQQFRVFIESLGFNSKHGIIRDQYSSLEELRNTYIISRYSTDSNLNNYEEDIHDIYVDNGIVDRAMTFPRRTSLLLMASDFISAGQSNDNVLIMLGIDEHKYVLYTNVVKERLLMKESGLRSDFDISTIYNRITKGFNGYPKMSKSFPQSSISMVSTPESVKRLILDETDPVHPADSLVFTLMLELYFIKFADLAAAMIIYSIPSRWHYEKLRFVDYINYLIKLWGGRQ